ncbi:MAG: DUF4124 domain-containing protein [Cellvibrionaceae bacterium]
MLQRISALLALTLTASLCLAEIYKTTDEHGNVVYTNVPTPTQQAEKVDLPSINQQPAVKFKSRPKQQEKAQQAYTLHISSPTNDSVITGGNLSVVVHSNPKLPPGARMDLTFNGVTKKSGQPGTFNFTNLDRGSYTLQAVAYDKNKKALAKSSSITVHIKRHFRTGG